MAANNTEDCKVLHTTIVGRHTQYCTEFASVAFVRNQKGQKFPVVEIRFTVRKVINNDKVQQITYDFVSTQKQLESFQDS